MKTVKSKFFYNDERLNEGNRVEDYGGNLKLSSKEVEKMRLLLTSSES